MMGPQGPVPVVVAQRHQPEVLKIVRPDGSDANGTRNIVGQLVQLRIETNPPGRSVSNIQWAIPPETVKRYTTSRNIGAREELAARDLDISEPRFYWINSGRKRVEVAANVDGTRQTASADITVAAPTRCTMTSRTGMVDVCNLLIGGVPELQLVFIGNSAQGIHWNCAATIPPGGEGEIACVQLTNGGMSFALNDESISYNRTGNEWMLDESFPYAPSTPAPHGGRASFSDGDTPGCFLTSTESRKERDERFRLYFIYRPTGTDSIWVTLMRLDWFWRGKTSRIGAPSSTDNRWTPPVDVDWSRNPVGHPTTELPIWTHNSADIRTSSRR